MRNAAFGACFTYYLGTGLLLSKEQTADVLGMHALPSDRMMLATDEYLHGLISMANELPRLAMNAVTAGDFGAPVRIAAFVKQLHAAFQVLNLKNDILRKRFDGLKVRLRLPTHAVRRETRRRDHVRYPLAQPGLRPGGHGATQRPDRAAGHARRARLALRKKKKGGVSFYRDTKEKKYNAFTRPACRPPCSRPWGTTPYSETRRAAGAEASAETNQRP